MRKIFSLFLIILSMFTMVSCNDNAPQKEYLEEDEDYIDISQTYDGENILYDKTKWLPNFIIGIG